MAQAAHRRRQVVCEAEFCLRTGAGVLGEVRALFRRGNSPGSARGRRAGAASRRTCSKYCDENTIGVDPDARPDVHRHLRTGRRAGGGARRTSARNRPGHPDPCRRRQRRVHRAVHPAGAGMGFPHREGQVDQRLGPQIRAGAARRRLGDLARQGGSARRADLQRRLSRRKHADLRAELQPARRADHRAILQFPAPRPRGLCGDPAGLRRHRAMARRRDRQARSAGAGL